MRRRGFRLLAHLAIAPIAFAFAFAGCVASQGRDDVTTCAQAFRAEIGASCDFAEVCQEIGVACPETRSCIDGVVVISVPRCVPDAGPDAQPDAPPPPDAQPDAPPPPPDAQPDAPPPPPDARPDAPPPPPRDAMPDAPPPPRDAAPDMRPPDPVWMLCQDFVDLGGHAGDRCDPDTFLPCSFSNGCCDRAITCTMLGRTVYSDSCIPECEIPECEGYAPPPPAFVPCTSGWDCEDGESCIAPGVRSCGDVCEESECVSDADCPLETVCEIDPTACPCGSAVERCRAVCALSGCMPDEACMPDGHCRALSCIDAWDCPASSSCHPDHADADRHGCVRRSCFSDADCDCGSCIDDRCYDGPGTCMFLGG